MSNFFFQIKREREKVKYKYKREISKFFNVKDLLNKSNLNMKYVKQVIFTYLFFIHVQNSDITNE